jgi:hypothetical protein
MEFNATTLIVGFCITGCLVLGTVFVVRARKPKEEPLHYFRCPSCKRKLKYLAHQAGHKGMCSTCKEKFVFPFPQPAHR